MAHPVAGKNGNGNGEDGVDPFLVLTTIHMLAKGRKPLETEDVSSQLRWLQALARKKVGVGVRENRSR